MGTHRNILLSLTDVCKSFSGNDVLKKVTLTMYAGEAHILLGANGAGKSTLIKLMTGAQSLDTGEFMWKGEPVTIRCPKDAIEIGIACIYQELNLIPELMVYESIFLGRELKTTAHFLDIHTMRRKAVEYITKLGLGISPDTKISSLGMGQKQLVEIARALSMDAKVIIMDEPTSSLSEMEAENLFAIIRDLKKQGIAILYISHRLEELKKIGDRISVLRDGCLMETSLMEDISVGKMIRLMVGRDVGERYPLKQITSEQEGFRIEQIQVKGSVHQVNFTAYQGQILGISGLVGSGRTELLRGVFGIDPIERGSVYVFGKKVVIRSPRDALKAGLAFIPENRKEEGLILEQSVEFNMSLAALHDCFLIKNRELHTYVQKYVNELQIYPKDVTNEVVNLSGGNQQKVVIAKWLSTGARVYIFDEPTRGIDVGAKIEVYHVLNSLVEKGAIVLVVSSELREILGICHRVLVMRDGAITGDFLTKDTDQEMLMRAATGGIMCKQQ